MSWWIHPQYSFTIYYILIIWFFKAMQNYFFLSHYIPDGASNFWIISAQIIIYDLLDVISLSLLTVYIEAGLLISISTYSELSP